MLFWTSITQVCKACGGNKPYIIDILYACSQTDQSNSQRNGPLGELYLHTFCQAVRSIQLYNHISRKWVRESQLSDHLNLRRQ